MKVLFLGISASIKGPRDGITYPFIAKEMRALVERGFDVLFLCRHLPAHREIDGVTYLSMDQLLERHKWQRVCRAVVFFVKHFRALRTLAQCDLTRTFTVIAAERCIGKIIDEFGVDIVHTHFLWPTGEAGILCSQERAVPVVATLRGAELVNRPDLNYGSLRNPFFRLATELSFPLISRFTVPNHQLSDRLTEEFGVLEERVMYLPNGVEKFEVPDLQNPPSERIRFIAVGRLTELKNIGVLIEAARSCVKHDIDIVIVGEGNLKDELHDSINRYGLKNVVLHPEVSKEELYNMMANADCLIHPSFLEGMPNVVLESLAMGRPCLVSDIPVHREIINEGVNGWLFDPTQADELSERMIKVATDRGALDRMSEQCRNTARHFTLDRKIDGYAMLYAELGELRSGPHNGPASGI